MNILVQTGQLLLSLSILVIIHEFGHFFFAKLFKTRVEKFYLFFDPWFSLFKFKRGETEYGLGWLPLGGYVKISGMIDESMDKEAMKLPPQPWEFRSKPTWQRLLIMIGGVLVNFIAAIVIYWMLLYSVGEQYIPVSNAKYGLYYTELGHNIGLKDGDVVLKADNFEIDGAEDIAKYLILDDVKTLTVKRADSLVFINVPEGYSQQLIAEGRKGFANLQVPFVIDSVVPGNNAAKAGIIKGDSIVMVNNQIAAYYHQFVKILSDNKGKEVTISVARDTAILNLQCQVTEDGKIGIGNLPLNKYFDIRTTEYSFFAAFPAGVEKGFSILFSYIKQLKKIFTKEGIKQVGGFGTMGSLFLPVWDWVAFWSLTGLISIILAFMNILPIPALDGGHVMFLLYEMVTGRKPSDKFMEYAQITGMILLLALLVYANGNDIFKAFK